MPRGKIIVFVGPSGVGKATIEKRLFQMGDLNLVFSVSATSRPARRLEKDGVDYHFMSLQEFEKRVSQNEFLEWSNHFNQYYGTLRSEVEKILAVGKNAFLEIETNGVKQLLKTTARTDLITIFVKPPSMGVLAKRIRARDTETPLQIADRLRKARHEMEMAPHFDYVVVNHGVKATVHEIAAIIRSRVPACKT